MTLSRRLPIAVILNSSLLFFALIKVMTYPSEINHGPLYAMSCFLRQQKKNRSRDLICNNLLFFHLFVIPLFSIEWRIHEENVSQFNQRRRRAQHRELSLRSVVMQRFTIRSLRDESKGRENRNNDGSSSSHQSRREARNEESKLLNQPTNEWIKNGSERVGIYEKKATTSQSTAEQRWRAIKVESEYKKWQMQ